jgi:glycerate 2-kinase
VVRVLIAPDSFGDSLTAVRAAEAIAAGWRRARPDDTPMLAPQSDGGPGFVGVLASRFGGKQTLRVSGPLTAKVSADWVLDAGAGRIVVGLGGSSCTDGGRGMVYKLGADVAAARERLARVELIAGTDVEHPLLGPMGAAQVFGPQKGADPETVLILEQRLTDWAAELDAAAGREVSAESGAGAA